MKSAFELQCADILDLAPDFLSPYNEHFDKARKICRVGVPEDYDEQSVVFVDQEGLARQMLDRMPALMVTTGALADLVISLLGDGQTSNIAITANPRLAMAVVRTELDNYDPVDAEWPDIHPTAQIHESAHIVDGVRVGPGAVVGARASIAAGTVIRANAVIERDANIGERCVIHPGVNIGYGCILGDDVIVHSNSVIGMQGFGFVQDEDKRFVRMPQTGRVVIKDDVVIGSSCNIDRGTIGDTVLETGVRLDAMVHIAHNVEIGEHSLITAHCSVAGSTRIGKHVIMSGQTGVLDHKRIADNTVFVHRAGVIEDIDEPGMYGGLPAKPWKDHVRRMGLSKRVEKLEKRLRKLEENKD